MIRGLFFCPCPALCAALCAPCGPSCCPPVHPPTVGAAAVLRGLCAVMRCRGGRLPAVDLSGSASKLIYPRSRVIRVSAVYHVGGHTPMYTRVRCTRTYLYLCALVADIDEVTWMGWEVTKLCNRLRKRTGRSIRVGVRCIRPCAAYPVHIVA